jgi:hypothetical protein
MNTASSNGDYSIISQADKSSANMNNKENTMRYNFHPIWCVFLLCFLLGEYFSQREIEDDKIFAILTVTRKNNLSILAKPAR